MIGDCMGYNKHLFCFITKTCPCNDFYSEANWKNLKKKKKKKNGKKKRKNLDIFNIGAHNIHCGYTVLTK